MSDFRPRTFASEADVVRLGEGFIACTLPRAEWTHEAHLAATVYLVTRRGDIDAEKQLPVLVRRFNESVGGVNSDSEGYHETITRTYLCGIREFLRTADLQQPLEKLVNQLLLSPAGHREWPLRFYSPERLSSVEARRRFIEPDRQALP